MYAPLDKNGCDQAWLYDISLPIFGVVCFMDGASDVCPNFLPLLSAVIPCDFALWSPPLSGFRGGGGCL